MNSTLLTLIVAVLVLLVLISVIIIFAQKSDKATQHTLCRASVILRGKATITLIQGVANMEKLTPLVCTTSDLGTLKGDREGVKKQIADNMAKCWWQFAEGSVQDIFMVERKEKGCFVCYTFNLEKDLDLGEDSKINIMAEPAVRDKNNVSMLEMTNYLFSESYNPGIIYGGGTKNYLGIVYSYGIDGGFNDPEVYRQNRLKRAGVNGFVLDYAGTLSSTDKEKISLIGSELQQKHLGNLLVLTAEEFNGIEKTDARAVIENTNLNTNSTSFDGILVMIDYSQQKIRIHIGSDLSVLIKEYELSDILEREFTKVKDDELNDCTDSVCRVNAINLAFMNSLEAITNKIMNKGEDLPGISPKSYYYYVSNAGLTWPIIQDIEPQKTYAIAYVGVSDEINAEFWRKAWNLNVEYAGMDFLTKGAYSDKLSVDITVDRPQGIIVAEVNKIGAECTTIKAN